MKIIYRNQQFEILKNKKKKVNHFKHLYTILTSRFLKRCINLSNESVQFTNDSINFNTFIIT